MHILENNCYCYFNICGNLISCSKDLKFLPSIAILGKSLMTSSTCGEYLHCMSAQWTFQMNPWSLFWSNYQDLGKYFMQEWTIITPKCSRISSPYFVKLQTVISIKKGQFNFFVQKWHIDRSELDEEKCSKSGQEWAIITRRSCSVTRTDTF